MAMNVKFEEQRLQSTVTVRTDRVAGNYSVLAVGHTPGCLESYTQLVMIFDSFDVTLVGVDSFSTAVVLRINRFPGCRRSGA